MLSSRSEMIGVSSSFVADALVLKVAGELDLLTGPERVRSCRMRLSGSLRVWSFST
jgi:hypothetical protein